MLRCIYDTTDGRFVYTIMKITFGQFVRSSRIKRGLSLREFCKITHYDVGYISRLENEILPAPSDNKLQAKLARSLNVKPGTKEWDIFHDLAAISLQKIPSDLTLNNPQLLNYLPAFLRKANKEDFTKNDVEEFLKLIKGDYKEQ